MGGRVNDTERGSKRREAPPSIPPEKRVFWNAVSVGTFFSLASFWAVFLGATAISGDAQPGPLSIGGLLADGGRFNPDSSATIWFGIGLVQMPVAFFVMAKMTLKPFRMLTVVNASMLALALWVWLPAITAEPLTPTVAAYSAGGAMVLGYRHVKKVRYRMVAVLFLSIYVFLFFGIVPLVSLVLGPLAALPAIGWADHIAMRRTTRMEAGGAAPPRLGRKERKEQAAAGGRRSRRSSGSVPARRAAPQRRGRSGVKRRR